MPDRPAATPDPRASDTGERAIGGYILERKLGEGGMGAVFRARHPSFPGVAFALKILATGSGADATRWARFEREMQILAALKPHPNLVRIHGGKLEGVRPFYVMELVEGPSLTDLVARKPMEPRRAVEIVRAIADAVAHIHAQGIIHRDLKPANIIMGSDGAPRVCDFGLARMADSNRLTRSGAFLGTVYFAPPEQLSGSVREVGAPADVYALGGVLWYCLVGRAPFEADSLQALLSRVLSTNADPPSLHAPEVDPDLDAICLRALAKKPADRQGSATELRDELDAWLAGERHVKGGRAWRRLALAAGALVLLAAAALGWRALRSRELVRQVDAAIAEKTAAAVAERLAALDARGAPPDSLEPVRARLAALASAEAAAPDATVATLRATVALVERAHVADATRTAVRLRLCEALARDAATAGPAESLALRREYGAAALGCAPGVNLLGEAGSGPSALDVLVDRSRPELVDAAWKLADARLRVHMNDRPARALRAYATLARHGGPTRALGEGTLALDGLEIAVLDDLACARELGGQPAARAAWLLVEVACAMGPHGAGHLAEALEAARRSAFAAPEAELLSAVVDAAPPAADKAIALFARLAAALKQGEPLAPFALAILFAEWGAPGAVDHPELAREKKYAALEAIVRVEGVERFKPRETTPPDRDLLSPVQIAWNGILEKRSLFKKTEDAAAVANLRALVAEAVKAAPAFSETLDWCGNPAFDRLSRCVFILFKHRVTLEIDNEVECFYRPARELQKATSKTPYGDHWNVPWKEFDAALADSLAKDELLQLALEHGLPRQDVARATRGAEALRRLYEMTEESVSAEDAPRILFEALVRMEEYVRFAGASALPFREKLRLLAFPGGLGDALAALDVARMIELADVEPTARRFDEYLTLAAAHAAEAPEGSLSRQRATPTFELARSWLHALALEDSDIRGGTNGPRGGEERLVELLNRYRDRMRVRPEYAALVMLRDSALDEDFAPTPADREKIKNPKPFSPPRLRSRP